MAGREWGWYTPAHRNPGLQNGTAMHIDLFKNTDSVETFPAGAAIFSEGEDSDGLMYVLLEGEVEVFVGGKPVNLIGPGEFLGEIGLIDRGPRSATAIATVESKLAPINEKRFQFLVRQTPNFALAVMRSMAERLRLPRD